MCQGNITSTTFTHIIFSGPLLVYFNNTHARDIHEAVQARAAKLRKNKGNTTTQSAGGSTSKLPPKIVINKDTFVDTLPLPTSYEDAITGPYRDYWIRAIAEELANLTDHKVWKKQKLPRNARPVKGKMVWKWKPTAQNTLHKAKCRFTMAGYSQQQGKHYSKTHASVAALMTIFLTCIVAVECDMALHQTDLRAAYLTAPLEPDVELYVQPPPMIDLPDGWGLRLYKALYGSKQGAQRLDVHKEKQLTAAGFIRSCAEPSLYFMPQDSELGLVLICTVVDDFLICCRDEVMQRVKDKLRAIWTITDHGPAQWFINLKISRDRASGFMKLDQSAYAEAKAREFKLENDAGPILPMPPSSRLTKDMVPDDDAGKEAMAKVPYRSMTGSINYFRLTRPDLAVSSSTCSQFNSGWGPEHVHAAKQLLRHAHRFKHWGIGFAKSGKTLNDPWVVEVWVDASHASCPMTRRSRSGFFVTINGNLLSYKSKLQPGAPAQSSTEAEYRALSAALNEVIWIMMVLEEIGIRVKKPISIKEDNEATIKLGENNMASARSKHIDIRHHVVRYHNSKGTIKLQYVSTSSMIADMLTKCLTRPGFERLRSTVMTDRHVDINDDRYRH